MMTDSSSRRSDLDATVERLGRRIERLRLKIAQEEQRIEKKRGLFKRLFGYFFS